MLERFLDVLSRFQNVPAENITIHACRNDVNVVFSYADITNQRRMTF